MHLDRWADVDVGKLLNLLSRALNLELKGKERSLILKASAGSPRILKRLLKKIRMFPEWSVSRVIEEVKGEDI